MLTIDINLDGRLFNDVYLPHLKNDSRIQIYYGGASSGKSYFIAQKKVYQHLKYPGRVKPRCTLLLRKVQRTIRNSNFKDVVNVINKWGLNGSVFKINKSDLEIHRVDGRTSFISAGLDDVEKLKSISGVTDIWFEEATEGSEDDILQLDLRIRGKQDVPKEIVLSFNPISALHHIKRNFFDVIDSDVSTLKTTFKDNKFLDEQDIRRIEGLKKKDKNYYNIYALGEWGVLGELIFSNYEVHDFDLNAFNYQQLRHGIDWGFIHPSVILRAALKENEIWILKTLYEKGLTNTELREEAEAQGFEPGPNYIADSSEPARIKEWMGWGWGVRAARKGKDSVKFGLDYLKRRKIHIHPSNVEFINEIQSYVYEKDKDGNVLEEPIDFNDDCMAALRYAFERDAHRATVEWARR